MALYFLYAFWNNSVHLEFSKDTYIPEEDWERNWTVTSSRSNKVVHVGKTRQSCADFIEKRTDKKVSFVSNERYLKEVAKHNRL